MFKKRENVNPAPKTLQAFQWILSRISRHIPGAPGQIWQQYKMNGQMVDL